MSPERTGDDTAANPSENNTPELEMAAGAPAELAIGEKVVLKLTEEGLVIFGKAYVITDTQLKN
jgi:hypothetical protein